MIRLYDYLPSGNDYKVRLLLTQLGIPFELVEKDVAHGETRTPEFLRRNLNGRTHAFFVADRYTIADIAHAYTHVVHEGDFDLTPFPAIRTWRTGTPPAGHPPPRPF